MIETVMGMILKIIGGIWALIGLWGITKMVWWWATTAHPYASVLGVEISVSQAMTTSFMGNMIVYIIPGLVIAGLGVLIDRQRETPSRQQLRQLVRCELCGNHVPILTARRDHERYIGECCWDERATK